MAPRFSVIRIDHDPFDWAHFAKPDSIEDRRNENLPLGPFGTPGLIENNVFTKGDGTMVALDPAKDFIPQPATPSRLSIAAGLNDIKLIPVDHDPFDVTETEDH